MTIARPALHRALALVALALATLAAVTGQGAPARRVDALELATWIRSGKPVRVIGLKGEGSADELLLIPGADIRTLAEVAREHWEPGIAVVFYGEGEALASRAQTMVPAANESTYVLRDGVSGWVRTIAAPVLPSNPTPEQAEAWQEIAELSRWFGGVPRVGVASDSADSLAAAVARIRRRGC